LICATTSRGSQARRPQLTGGTSPIGRSPAVGDDTHRYPGQPPGSALNPALTMMKAPLAAASNLFAPPWYDDNASTDLSVTAGRLHVCHVGASLMEACCTAWGGADGPGWGDLGS